MKKILKILLVFILVLGFSACGKSNNKGNEKVKVYMFEAGGCPYCEKQFDYLTKLNGYGTKFEVIRKELYVDHINWVIGKDYDLGEATATEFFKKGFTEASANGTPFVVISDLYAATGYSEELESVIDVAYKEGDRDIVGCLAEGNKCEIRESLSDTDKKINNLERIFTLHFIIIYVLLGSIIIYFVIDKARIKKKKN